MKFNFKQVATRLAGSAAGGAVSYGIDKMLPTLDPKIRAGITAVAGAVVPELMPKVKILSDVGSGMIGAATKDLLNEFIGGGSTPPPVTSGIGEDQFNDDQFVVDHDMSGLDEDPISGFDEDPISGIDDIVQVD